jgi:glyoxylase-like metal-dependent hydrolase (beta-lactamase superfamily II)
VSSTYRVGSIDLALLSDGTFYYDAGAVFGIVPRVMWERLAGALDSDHRMSLSLNSLLLRSRGRLVLIETGIGDKRQAARQASLRSDGNLLAELATLGVDPAEVDVVINTHLHADHCGWNTRYVDGVAVPTFPNAIYMVTRAEWAAAAEPDERTRATYIADNILPVAAHGRLHLVDRETRVTDEVTIVPTPGHSAGRASVIVSSGGETAVYIGDLAQTAVQLERTAWVSAFDIMPLVTMATKKALVARAIAEGSLMIGAHIPGAGRMSMTEGGIGRWTPVPPIA